MKGEEEDEKERKSVITKIISYFKYDDKLDKKINISLLFNAYISFFELIALIFINVYFSSLKISSFIMIYIIGGIGQMGVNFLPRVNIIMLFFEIMIGSQICQMGIMIMVVVMTIQVLTTIKFTCMNISEFFVGDTVADNTSASLCSELSLKYMIQIITYTIVMVLRLVGIFLGSKAYKVQLDIHKEKILKQKNEIRYMKMKLTRKDKMDQIIANRKI